MIWTWRSHTTIWWRGCCWTSPTRRMDARSRMSSTPMDPSVSLRTMFSLKLISFCAYPGADSDVLSCDRSHSQCYTLYRCKWRSCDPRKHQSQKGQRVGTRGVLDRARRAYYSLPGQPFRPTTITYCMSGRVNESSPRAILSFSSRPLRKQPDLNSFESQTQVRDIFPGNHAWSAND